MRITHAISVTEVLPSVSRRPLECFSVLCPVVDMKNDEETGQMPLLDR